MLELRKYRLVDIETMEPRQSELKAPDFLEEERAINKLRLSGPAFTMWRTGAARFPYGAAGVIVYRQGQGEAWFRGSLKLECASNRIKWICAKRVLERLRTAAQDYSLVRVQATIRSSDARAIKFIEWLGFQHEGRLVNFGGRDEHFEMYARTDLLR